MSEFPEPIDWAVMQIEKIMIYRDNLPSEGKLMEILERYYDDNRNYETQRDADDYEASPIGACDE